eukprot:125215-Pelagomonas_calceolata.AAC.3
MQPSVSGRMQWPLGIVWKWNIRAKMGEHLLLLLMQLWYSMRLNVVQQATSTRAALGAGAKALPLNACSCISLGMST